MSNVDTAKLFFGVVLNKLQDAFPAAIYLSAQNIWPEFEKVAKGGAVSVQTGERYYRTLPLSELAQNQSLQEHYTKLMLRWMAAEGYLISDPTSGFHFDYVLSSKALAALNIAIEKEKKTIGEALANAALKTSEAAQGELIGRLVGRIFDYFNGLSL
jgi:hypothetical protein